MYYVYVIEKAEKGEISRELLSRANLMITSLFTPACLSEESSGNSVFQEAGNGLISACAERMRVLVAEGKRQAFVKLPVGLEAEESRAEDTLVAYRISVFGIHDTTYAPETGFALGLEMPAHYEIGFCGAGVDADTCVGLVDKRTGSGRTFEPFHEGRGESERLRSFFGVILLQVVEKEEGRIALVRELLKVRDSACGGRIVFLGGRIESAESVDYDERRAESADFESEGGNGLGALISVERGGNGDREEFCDVFDHREHGFGGVLVVYIEYGAGADTEAEEFAAGAYAHSELNEEGGLAQPGVSYEDVYGVCRDEIFDYVGYVRGNELLQRRVVRTFHVGPKLQGGELWDSPALT